MGHIPLEYLTDEVQQLITEVPEAPLPDNVARLDKDNDFGSHIIKGASLEFLSLQNFVEYKISDKDNGMFLGFNNQAGTTTRVILNKNSPKGFHFSWLQEGIGGILFVAETGATYVHPDNHKGARKQYSPGSCFVRWNGNAAQAAWILGGDTA